MRLVRLWMSKPNDSFMKGCSICDKAVIEWSWQGSAEFRSSGGISEAAASSSATFALPPWPR